MIVAINLKKIDVEQEAAQLVRTIIKIDKDHQHVEELDQEVGNVTVAAGQ